MLRPIAAGLMCMGLVALGVTALRGQETGQSELIAEEASAAEGAVVAPEGEGLVEIQIGSDDGLIAAQESGANIEVQGEDVIIRSQDGRIVEKISRAAPRLAAAQLRLSGGPAIDPGTREALGKVVAGLKEEVKRLEFDGKAEEAKQKFELVLAIERLLNAGPRRAGFVVQRPGIPDGPAAEEIKKLHERIHELRTQAGQKPQDGEAHAKSQKEMADLHRKLAELHRGAVVGTPGGTMPGMPGMPGQPGMVGQRGMPGQPGMPVAPGGFPGGGIAGGGFGGTAAGQFFGFQHGGMPAEAQALTQKSAALMQAAAQLQQAGLEEQARDLRKQAEKLEAAAEKIRAKTQPAFDGGPGGFGAFGGGPPGELQKTIHELQEQIQQLRKEVGELRELLQQRRQ